VAGEAVDRAASVPPEQAVLRLETGDCNLADCLHGSGVPGRVCLAPDELYLILQLVHCFFAIAIPPNFR
jgi:hypothetical protein